jgi:GNAT superfamily N-acetyltransferase
MNTDNHCYKVDPQIVETWVKGWAISRDVPPPVRDSGSYRVDVGWPDQKARYVFPELTKDIQHLANTISEPWVFLKVCASPAMVSQLLPPHWEIQKLGFMMTCTTPMINTKAPLQDGYVLDLTVNITVPMARVLTTTGEVVASGRIAFVDDFVIYDKIETHPDHRRRGLGSVILTALESIGAARGYTKGVLVATEAGKALYESLGWQLYSLYTTAVIPAPDNG